jgi:HNH endonuclease
VSKLPAALIRAIKLIPEIRETDFLRFIIKVSVRGATECWPWLGRKDKRGYGRFYLRNKHYAAHRVAHVIASGVDPRELVIRHTCDNPICVNPDHLIPGTVKDNVRDKMARGRHRFVVPLKKGSAHGGAKLSETYVIAIRWAYDAYGHIPGVGRRLAKEFGVSPATISLIGKRKGWRHIA